MDAKKAAAVGGPGGLISSALISSADVQAL
jgi:hypothetical protein